MFKLNKVSLMCVDGDKKLRVCINNDIFKIKPGTHKRRKYDTVYLDITVRKNDDIYSLNIHMNNRVLISVKSHSIATLNTKLANSIGAGIAINSIPEFKYCDTTGLLTICGRTYDLTTGSVVEALDVEFIIPATDYLSTELGLETSKIAICDKNSSNVIWCGVGTGSEAESLSDKNYISTGEVKLSMENFQVINGSCYAVGRFDILPTVRCLKPELVCNSSFTVEDLVNGITLGDITLKLNTIGGEDATLSTLTAKTKTGIVSVVKIEPNNISYASKLSSTNLEVIKEALQSIVPVELF